MSVLPASSGVCSCDVPFRYASESIPRYRGTVARRHAHHRGLATAIHKISRLAFLKIKDKRMFVNRKDYFLGGRMGVERLIAQIFLSNEVKI